MNWIDVISAGPGNASLLTPQAFRALEEAETVFCADRYAGLVPGAGKCRPLTPLGTAMDGLESLWRQGRRTAVLVSGDAGLYSLLSALSRRFGGETLRVYPGISSLQAFCAALGIPWQEAAVLSAHGRELPPSALCHAVRTHRKTLLLLDGQHDPHWVRQSLQEGGLGDARLTIGERISCPDQRIAPYEDRDYDSLSVALIRNDNPEAGLPPAGLRDDAFIRGRTPMTKREIRVQILSALELPEDAVVWDVGAGTGSVTVECARQCPLGEVYAIERDADALALIRQNTAHFYLQNVRVREGNAPEALQGLPAPTHVFLGGTGGQTENILKHLESMACRIRLCATAVTMESVQEYMRLMKAYDDFYAIQIAVSRIEEMGRVHMLRASNPVFVFSAVMGGKS